MEAPDQYCRSGTLFEKDGKGILIVQLRYSKARAFYWSALDQDLANDIYLNNNFASFFSQNASEKPYPILKVRSVMWTLRMKPLKKEKWEEIFT